MTMANEGEPVHRRRTKTDILIDAAVELRKTQVEMEQQIAKFGLALQGVTSSMSTTTFDSYMDRIRQMEGE